MVQHVKDPALSLQQLGSLLWHGFAPWPGNFHMLQMQPKKKQKKKGNGGVEWSPWGYRPNEKRQ